jgi:hypothetical protein
MPTGSFGGKNSLEEQMFARGVPFMLVLVASSAMALDTAKLDQWGSLGLEELTSLIDKSSQLKGAVAEALVKINKKADDIRCEGTRFSNRWRHLSGERASPYICNIGDKWLEIRATARVTGRRGRVFETITPEAMKNATDISETNPTWKWTDQDPRATL